MMGASSGILPVEGLHTVLYCRNWEECVSFYRDTLGFPVAFANNLFVEVRVSSGACIGLLDAGRTRRTLGLSPDNFLLSFQVADVEKTHGILRERYQGVSEIKNHPWGARLFELQDPEGRVLEFWSNT
jgi:catechol 2,3-dioxygenase-like lactoylglutathione lyase family enzyme